MVANSEVHNPNEHLPIPNWITADYFDSILKKDEAAYAKILAFTPTAAIPPGENFTSIMLRIHLELEMQNGSSKQKTYILKTMLEDERGGTIIREMSLFPKELDMYHKYLPAFEALYQQAGRSVQLAPKCLFTEQKSGCINFVFEDLNNKKFQNINRITGFDMEHMVRVLHKLAEFHAASVVYVEQNGPFPEQFNYGFINGNEKGQFQEQMFISKESSYKQAMATWGLKDGDKYIRKFPTFEQYSKCCRRTLNSSANHFNVLTHGDFWSSNIMQNYQPDGSVDELLIVDYQFCKWGSPAEDLLFIITISAAKNIRIKEFDHFVQIYHEHLVECLKLLNYKQRLPKLRELQMDMYSETTTFYAFLSVFNHLLVVLLPTDKESNIETLMRKDEAGQQYRMRALKNPLFVEAMRDWFPFYHQRGIFNFEDYD